MSRPLPFLGSETTALPASLAASADSVQVFYVQPRADLNTGIEHCHRNQ